MLMVFRAFIVLCLKTGAGENLLQLCNTAQQTIEGCNPVKNHILLYSVDYDILLYMLGGPHTL